MAALRQEHRYGLSCGKINKNTPNQTLYHVKLTDTAIRTLEAHQNLKVREMIGFNFGAFLFFFSSYILFFLFASQVREQQATIPVGTRSVFFLLGGKSGV